MPEEPSIFKGTRMLQGLNMTSILLSIVVLCGMLATPSNAEQGSNMTQDLTCLSDWQGTLAHVYEVGFISLETGWDPEIFMPQPIFLWTSHKRLTNQQVILESIPLYVEYLSFC